MIEAYLNGDVPPDIMNDWLYEQGERPLDTTQYSCRRIASLHDVVNSVSRGRSEISLQGSRSNCLYRGIMVMPLAVKKSVSTSSGSFHFKSSSNSSKGFRLKSRSNNVEYRTIAR